MKLEELLLEVKQCMLELALKTTKHYITDLVIDFDRLDRLAPNLLDSDYKLIFIARECGTELGYENDERIKYYLNTEKNMEVYEIDIRKGLSFDFRPHFSAWYSDGEYKIFNKREVK